MRLVAADQGARPLIVRSTQLVVEKPANALGRSLEGGCVCRDLPQSETALQHVAEAEAGQIVRHIAARIERTAPCPYCRRMTFRSLPLLAAACLACSALAQPGEIGRASCREGG